MLTSFHIGDAGVEIALQRDPQEGGFRCDSAKEEMSTS
jgi:hypothetical protein